MLGPAVTYQLSWVMSGLDMAGAKTLEFVCVLFSNLK